MNRIAIFLLLFLIISPLAFSQATDSEDNLLEAYLEKNPQTIRAKFIYDGCNLSASADEDNVLIQIMIRNPMIQMRLMMQECYFYIDPTGRRKEKFAVILPSAKYLKNAMGNNNPRPSEGEPRPDMTSLITMMNLYGAEWDINGRSTQLHSNRFRVVFDTSEEALIYTMLLPKDVLLKEKRLAEEWAFGIYSPLDGSTPPQNGPMPNQNGRPQQRPDNRGGMRDDDSQLREFLSRVISQWITLPLKEIEEINSMEMVLGGEANTANQRLNVAVSLAGDTLGVTVEPKDLVLQFDFIMQGLEICLSSSPNDSILIRFPSAYDVKDQVNHRPDETISESSVGRLEGRPDIRYVLEAINDTTLSVSGSVEAEVLEHRIAPDAGKISFWTKLLTKDFKTDAMLRVVVSSHPSAEMLQSSEGADAEAKKSHVFQETVIIPLSYE